MEVEVPGGMASTTPYLGLLLALAPNILYNTDFYCSREKNSSGSSENKQKEEEPEKHHIWSFSRLCQS